MRCYRAYGGGIVCGQMPARVGASAMLAGDGQGKQQEAPGA